MDKYHIYISIKEDQVEILRMSDFGNNLNKLIAHAEKLLNMYKKKEKPTKELKTIK